MDFNKIQKLVSHRFNQMTKNNTPLYVVNTNPDELWELYLESFPAGTNVVHEGRKNREYDCSCCRNFIKRIGNVVTIKGNKIETLWDILTTDNTLQTVFSTLSEFVRNHRIIDVFIINDSSVGVKQNRDRLENGTVITWRHFHVDIPNHLSQPNVNEYRSQKWDNVSVLRRSLREISLDAIETVLELINQNSLYRGQQWKGKLIEFRKLHKEYHESDNQELVVWQAAIETHEYLSRIRNESMGLLLTRISDGADLESAVREYENMVAPHNYQRPKPIFTQRMIDEAKKTVEELGFLNSLQRRFATIDDLPSNNVLFMNSDIADTVYEVQDVFDVLSGKTSTKVHDFSQVTTMSVDDFVNDILPTTTNLEILFENQHKSNLMTLTTGNGPSMFHWSNNFGWSYKSGLADSAMKENVKNAGGKIDGDLRFSIQWNTDERPNLNDYDAHCHHPSGHIYYEQKGSGNGTLDVDIINPVGIAVENIVWVDKNRMRDGKYLFLVHNYSHKGGTNGFTAEIEFDGNIYTYDYPNDLRQNGTVEIATVNLSEKGNFSIKQHLSSELVTQETWNLTPNKFYPVSCSTLSPNYWDVETGNRHHFFFIPDAICDEPVRGIYNEFLNGDLRKHRKVFEALSGQLMVQESDSQLTGLGFSHNQEVTFRVTGRVKRIIKVKF